MTSSSRRRFLQRAALGAAATPLLAPALHSSFADAATMPGVPLIGDASPLDALSSMTKNAVRITDTERQQRRDKLSALLAERGVFAALIEPGSSLDYFTGVQWWLSERITAGLITAKGDTLFITPGFEESRLREMVGSKAQIITWEEDEDPFALLADWLRSTSPGAGTLALDEAVRYFIAHRLSEAAPGWQLTSAVHEVNACRMIKSPAELALMKLASDVTIAAYKAVHPLLEPGMSGPDVTALMQRAQARLGGETPAGGTQLGKGSALPHGSREPEYVSEGQVVLMDFGCAVGGYRSDISRTFVYGEASSAQKRLWDLVHRGQALAFENAKPGTPAGEVDKVVRRFYAQEGFGPGYQLPGLSHRLGHGIGLDVHEPINFVGNETTPLQPGMCLSNEPGLYIPGKYGVRLEDCLFISESGPRWFSTPSPSLSNPMGV
jgi:Xaa-Pro dipeptidase